MVIVEELGLEIAGLGGFSGESAAVAALRGRPCIGFESFASGARGERAKIFLQTKVLLVCISVL